MFFGPKKYSLVISLRICILYIAISTRGTTWKWQWQSSGLTPEVDNTKDVGNIQYISSLNQDKRLPLCKHFKKRKLFQFH